MNESMTIAANLRKLNLIVFSIVVCLVFSPAAFSQTQEILWLGAKPPRPQQPSGSSLTEAVFTVTNLNDSGAGSLRQAILDANARGGHDKIVFSTDGGGSLESPGYPVNQRISPRSRNVISLTSGQLVISDSLTIIGLGSDLLTVSAGRNSRVFQISPVAINAEDEGDDEFAEESGRSGGELIRFDGNFASISRMTIADGNAPNECGGGIRAKQTALVLNNVRVTQNRSARGGGVCFIGGDLFIENSIVSYNTATVGNGGGICAGKFAVNFNLRNSTVSHNYAYSGAGVAFKSGVLFISDSTLSRNNAGNQAGGIYLRGGESYLVNSTLSDNLAANFAGGALVLEEAAFTTVNATVSHNRADDGGGIQNKGMASVGNTIIANNQARSNADVAGVFVSYGTNLIGRAALQQGFTNNLFGDKVGSVNNPLDAMLGALQNNGGKTETRLPRIGSPAVNAANLCVTKAVGGGGCVGEPILFDQNGAGKSRSANGGVDIGAVEGGSLVMF